MESESSARKKRLVTQEERRHASQMEEIESRKQRIKELYERQLRNAKAAEEREKARHENRLKQIEAI